MASVKSGKGADTKAPATEINHDAAILIVEDEPEQRDMFVRLAIKEIKHRQQSKTMTAEQRQRVDPCNILAVSEMKSLEQAVTKNDNVIVALVDCRIPDEPGAAAHDQFVKKGDRIITGQHKSVDLIAEHLPGTPITLVSSIRRFQGTTVRYYQDRSDIELEFISKDQASKIKESIRHHLREYVRKG